METDAIRHAASAAGADLTESAGEQLASYTELLRERAVPLGMISQADSDRILERHVLDSLRAAPFVSQTDAASVVDLGSGAGLPGIPLAIALPRVRFVLAESRSKRAGFVELVVERLGLTNVEVHPDRAETLGDGEFDVATARAFAPPPVAWAAAVRLLRPGGALCLFAGAREALPVDLPGAIEVRVLGPAGEGSRVRAPSEPSSSWRTSRPTTLASVGDLVIITAK